MSKKKKIEIHQDEELAQIDDELESALDILESANLAVGGLLEEIEVANKQDTEQEPSNGNASTEENGVKTMDSSSPEAS